MISAGGCIINIEESNKIHGNDCVTKVRITAIKGNSIHIKEDKRKGEVLLTFKRPAANQNCMYCKGQGFIRHKSQDETCTFCQGKGIVIQKY